MAAGAGVGIGHVVWPGTPQATSNEAAESSSGTATAPGSDSSNGQPESGASNGNGGSGDQSSGGQGSSNAPNGDSNGGSADQGGSGVQGNSGSQGNSNGNSGGSAQPTWPGQLIPNQLIPQDLLPNGLNPNGTEPGGSAEQNGSGTSESQITTAPGSPSDISSIVDDVDQAMVDVNVTFQYQQAMGAGTGIVLTKSGEVLTNNHVINGATSISVTDLGNGKTYPATVVGYDPSADVAVLQLKGASNLATADIGDSDSVKVGEPVVGIGNAQGLGGTPSAAGGSVTALNQTITVGDEMYGTTEHLKGLIEVNAAIQSGDSGGPLVTAKGAVVGMDTAASVGLAATRSGHEGYAIPIDTAMTIASAIEAGHDSDSIHVGSTAALGILVSTGAQRSATGTSGGAVVAGVIAGGAGAKAGLVRGDVITKFDGHTIDSPGALTDALLTYHPGQSVTITWTDIQGSTQHATVKLGTGPAS